MLEGLNDFENLGASSRNAAAFGLDGVLLDERCADSAVPTQRAGVNGARAACPVRRRARPVAGGTGRRPGGRFPPPRAYPGRLARRRCQSSPRPSARRVMLGAEGLGLTPGALAAADLRVRIPMAPGVDSLNVATAAAVAFARLFGWD